MALKKLDNGRVAFTYTGTEWQVVGGTPDGWRTWTAGRIYPPAGTYWVEINDTAQAELRPSQTGTKLKTQQLLTVPEGEYIIMLYSTLGDSALITRLD